MREIGFALMFLVALAAAFPAASQVPQTSADQTALLQVTPKDRVLGQTDAPITIVEYASMTCPHCAHFANDVLPELKQKWIDTGKAKLVMRPFPLDQVALRAETLARCLPPDRYYPMIETLFKTQEKWAIAQDWRPALERTARLAGVSSKEFDACLANKGLEDEAVQSRLTASTQLDVTGTPTFFINGKKFEGPPTAQALDEVLSGLAKS
jgi:protein-disulfide isomerase